MNSVLYGSGGLCHSMRQEYAKACVGKATAPIIVKTVVSVLPN